MRNLSVYPITLEEMIRAVERAYEEEQMKAREPSYPIGGVHMAALKEASSRLKRRWLLIDEDTPRKKTLLFFGETEELGNGAMNWRMETGYIYPHEDGNEDWYWAGRIICSWEHKPSHWMTLPTPPSHT